jgi:thiamine-phosphate pyrophosphorylase
MIWKEAQNMKCDRKTMLLYAVTDRAWVGEQTLYEQVESALQGGATCIQLREKELEDEAFLAEAIEMNALCQSYKVPFIINDNVGVAVKCAADGVHVGQHDMEAGNVRELVGEGMILGVSVQTVEQALLAEEIGADYLGVGSVFATTTKLDADTVSCETLKTICDAVSIPVVAIGGIYKHNIMQLAGTGVDGVALVSAIFGVEDIENKCRELRCLSEEMVTA